MVLFQKPNKSAVVSGVSLLVFLVTSGWLRQVVALVFALSLAIWSIQEIQSGANLFRKGLGVVGLGIVVAWLFLFLLP